MTWDVSVAYCKSLALDGKSWELASIHSEEEWTEAKAAGATATCFGHCGPHLFTPCDWFWLGGRLVGPATVGQVVWVDGTPYDWSPSFFEQDCSCHEYLSAWPTVSCYGKGGGWADADGSWEMQALCKGSYHPYHFSLIVFVLHSILP